MKPPAAALLILPAVLLAAGCSGGSTQAAPSDPAVTTAAPTTSTSTQSSTQSSNPSSTPSSRTPTRTPSPSSSPTATKASSCLFTVGQVSGVLGGTWSDDVASTGSCVYRSDRGAAFATVQVPSPVDPGLRDAQRSCLPGVKPVVLKGDRSICVEKHAGQEYVVGNVAARGLLWLIEIVPASGGTHAAELRAMLGLVQAVPA